MENLAEVFLLDCARTVWTKWCGSKVNLVVSSQFYESARYSLWKTSTVLVRVKDAVFAYRTNVIQPAIPPVLGNQIYNFLSFFSLYFDCQSQF